MANKGPPIDQLLIRRAERDIIRTPMGHGRYKTCSQCENLCK